MLNPTQELAKLEELKRLTRDYSLFLYKPYGKQREFHAAGLQFRQRCLMAGNQLGKCVTRHSKIDVPGGTKRVCELRDGDVVLAWDGEKKVPASICQPFKKDGWHECLLLVMSDGRSIAVADHHRILTESGWIYASDLLRASSRSDLSIHDSGVRHLWKKGKDLLDRYSVDFRQYGAQLLRVADSGPEFSPSQGDVPPCNVHISCTDDPANTQSDSLLSKLCRRANLGAVRLSVARCVGWLAQVAYRHAEPNLQKRPIVRLLCAAASLALRSVGATSLPVLGASSQENVTWHTPDIDGSHIIAVIPIGRHEVYDFTVPKYSNYCGSGLIHHNTYAAGCETAMHLTGLYPDWWEGKRFKRATRGWAGSKNAEVARDGAQRILLGPTNAIGTGTIPRDRIIDYKKARGVPDAVESVLVRHATGDTSLLVFKGYQDGREAWQAETLDFVWFDEEPPEDIYSEGLTRTNNTKGIAYLTFTPLLGMTFVVLRFWNKEPGTILIQMTIDDVDHYTQEERDQIVAAYLPHEREARANGIPFLGSGKVFETPEADILESPLAEIPEHWTQIIGLDFGWNHPTAAVKLIHDPDDDVIHVASVYRQSRETPIIHAAAIKPWGTWIPVAWPKDGLQTEKGSGIQIAQFYRDQGLNMISDYAQFPDKRGVSVEAGLMEMSQRFDTGRLKVNRNLTQWIDEYRMYHRVDGKVVTLNEDLMCATRYGIVMLRYAISQEIGMAKYDRWGRHKFGDGTSWMSS